MFHSFEISVFLGQPSLNLAIGTADVFRSGGAQPGALTEGFVETHQMGQCLGVHPRAGSHGWKVEGIEEGRLLGFEEGDLEGIAVVGGRRVEKIGNVDFEGGRQIEYQIDPRLLLAVFEQGEVRRRLADRRPQLVEGHPSQLPVMAKPSSQDQGVEWLGIAHVVQLRKIDSSYA